MGKHTLKDSSYKHNKADEVRDIIENHYGFLDPYPEIVLDFMALEIGDIADSVALNGIDRAIEECKMKLRWAEEDKKKLKLSNKSDFYSCAPDIVARVEIYTQALVVLNDN